MQISLNNGSGDQRASSGLPCLQSRPVGPYGHVQVLGISMWWPFAHRLCCPNPGRNDSRHQVIYNISF